MIDAISIFTKGGVVLWSYYFIRLNENPIDKLVQTVLLEERAGDCMASLECFNLKWRFWNELGLVFVVVYQGIQSLAYLETLLQLTQTNFLAHLKKHGISLTNAEAAGGLSVSGDGKSPGMGLSFFVRLPQIFGAVSSVSSPGVNGSKSCGQQMRSEDTAFPGIPLFDAKFLKILEKCDQLQRKGFQQQEREKGSSSSSSSSSHSKSGGSSAARQMTGKAHKGRGRAKARGGGATTAREGRGSAEEEEEDGEGGGHESDAPDGIETDDNDDDDDDVEFDLQEIEGDRILDHVADDTESAATDGDTAASMGNHSGSKSGAGGLAQSKKSPQDTSCVCLATKERAGGLKTGKPRPAKKDASWASQRVTRRAMEALDYSKRADVEEEEENRAANRFVEEEEAESDASSLILSEDDTAAGEGGSRGGGGLFARFTSVIKDLTGNKELTPEELDSVLAEFRSSLMSKNVAMEVADVISESVKTSLVGSKTRRFTSAKQTVHQAMVNAVEMILTPKKSVDVLCAALEAKAQGKVYSIVFLGVNGVGKSTNLAKVCYYLKHKGGLSVMIAACDTFRSGAVEQLRTHARCLDVPLFERGYGKDAAHIARDALAFAKAEGCDVVLIDTAGRMQDNEPLMRALAKLVSLNQPDLILFVGEALVGNDAVDQLKKFNQCILDMDNTGRGGVDGILLTKFDTVDDKVGAALSMVYITGQPIIFVGTGQKYTHMRKLNVNTVVKSLLG